MLALPRSFCAGSSRVEHIRSAPSSMEGDIKQISYDLKVIQACEPTETAHRVKARSSKA
jgi:hypothetical protein